MSVLQLVWNAVKIAIVLIAIIDTTRNTLKFTSNTITRSEKLLRRSSLESIRDVHAESLDAQKSTASVIKRVCCAEIFASASSVKTTNLSVIKKSFRTSRETLPPPPTNPHLYVILL